MRKRGVTRSVIQNSKQTEDTRYEFSEAQQCIEPSTYKIRDTHTQKRRQIYIQLYQNSKPQWIIPNSFLWLGSYLELWKQCLFPRIQRWRTPARQQGWGTWKQLRCPSMSAGPTPAQCRAPWKLRKQIVSEIIIFFTSLIRTRLQ